MNTLPSQEEVNAYLDALRESGAVNMFGAGPYVEQAFNVDRSQARNFILTWMDTFADRKAKGEINV